jgi:ParB-like chromosome segregation protein Spo0J
MKSHPYANLFPILEEPELQELADDIAANGQHHPVIIDDKGQILDGRNRAAACALAQVEPSTKVFKGDDAEKLAFVLSVNLHRRHLDTAQRAMVAEKLAGLKHGEKKADSGIPLSQPTQAEVAKLLNVSVDSVKQARKIRKSATPETVAAVERGEITLNAAVATVKPMAKQPESSPKAATATAEPEVEKKSPAVAHINETLIKMGANKKRHPQLMQIANDALYRLTPEERCGFLASQVKRLTPEQQAQLIKSLS